MKYEMATVMAFLLSNVITSTAAYFAILSISKNNTAALFSAVAVFFGLFAVAIIFDGFLNEIISKLERRKDPDENTQ